MKRVAVFPLLALFFSVFLVCAGLLQLHSGLPPQKSGAVDQFNGALLWVASILALMLAAEAPKPSWKFLLWFGMSAGFGAVAIDEVFEFHETTKFSLGDDDYIKIIAWSCAGVAVGAIWRIARPGRTVLQALGIAFAFQTLWLLSDMGDGDFFSVPIPLINLLWLEEYFELLGSQFYVTALIAHYRDTVLAAMAEPIPVS